MIAKAARGKRASGASKTSGRLSVQWGFDTKHQFGKIPPIRSADFVAMEANGQDMFLMGRGWDTHKTQIQEGCDLVDIPAKANAMKTKTKIQEPWSAITGHRIYFRGYVDEIAPKKLVITEAGPHV